MMDPVTLGRWGIAVLICAVALLACLAAVGFVGDLIHRFWKGDRPWL